MFALNIKSWSLMVVGKFDCPLHSPPPFHAVATRYRFHQISRQMSTRRAHGWHQITLDWYSDRTRCHWRGMRQTSCYRDHWDNGSLVRLTLTLTLAAGDREWPKHVCILQDSSWLRGRWACNVSDFNQLDHHSIIWTFNIFYTSRKPNILISPCTDLWYCLNSGKC